MHLRLLLSCVLPLSLLAPALRAADDPALTPAQLVKHDAGTALPSPHAFQGIPGLARAPGGRWWATWYGGGTDESAANYCLLATSDDDGATWSPIRLRVEHPHEAIRTFDPVLWTDPRGTLWLFYAQAHTWWDGRAGVWAITCKNPDAATPTWSAPRRLADGIMMNKPIVLRDGRWLLPIALWNHPPKTDPKDTRRFVPPAYRHWNEAAAGTQVYVSTDHGETLRLLATVKVPDVLFDEHMFVERRDGSLWMLVRTRSGISESISKDGGRTWSAAKPAPIPHLNSRFFIRRLHSGRLLLVKHNPALDTFWLAGQELTPKTKLLEQRAYLTAYLSDDDGATWHGGLLLDARLGVSYPDGDQAPDGRILVIYDRNRKLEGEILVASFTEADVAAGEWRDAASRSRVLVNRMAPQE